MVRTAWLLPFTRWGLKALQWLGALRLSAWVCGGAVMLCCQLSHAQGACGTRAWIAVDFSATDWPSTFCDTVLADLRASLGERKIDVCQAPTPTAPPIARITLTSPKPLTAGIMVVAADETATKRASRTVTLDNVPADGRAFAVALATDELLSASWDELALVVPEPEPEPEPVVIEPLVHIPAREPTSPLPNNIIGVFGLSDMFLGAQRSWGGELRYGIRMGENSPWSLNFALGASAGERVATTNGSITSHAWLGGAWLRYAWLERNALSLGVALGTRLGLHTFVGHPPGDQTSSSSDVETDTASDWVYALGIRGDARIALTQAVGLDLAVDVGMPVSGVEITDTFEVVTGTTGLRVTPSVGVVVQW